MADNAKTPSDDATKPGFQQDSAKSGDKDNPANSQSKMKERLDEALEETFPSSDPVWVKITK